MGYLDAMEKVGGLSSKHALVPWPLAPPMLIFYRILLQTLICIYSLAARQLYEFGHVLIPVFFISRLPGHSLILQYF